MHTTIIGPTLFIAGAQAAVCRQPDGLRAWQLDDDGELVERHLQAQLFLDCPSEKRVVHDLVDLQQLKTELQLWSAKQHTLYCLLAGMDRDLRDTTRRRRLVAAEALLADPACAAFARARLLGCVMPESADLIGAMAQAWNLPLCINLYQELSAGHIWIPMIKGILSKVIAEDSAQHFVHDEIALRLLDFGIIADGVSALAQNGPITLYRLQFNCLGTNHTLPDMPNIKRILSRFHLQLRLVIFAAKLARQKSAKSFHINATPIKKSPTTTHKGTAIFNSNTLAHSNEFSWKQVPKPKLN